jgi:hypothetical protein
MINKNPKQNSRLHDVPALSSDIDVVNRGRSGHTGGALLNLKDVGAVLESAAELSSVDGEAQTGVDVGVDDRILQN